MSTPEVTITLGRTGQVVKRKRADGGGAYSHLLPMRERPGSGGGDSSSLLFNYKRQRSGGVILNTGSRSLPDAKIGRNDLRYNLMCKHLSRETQNHADNRDDHGKQEFRGESSAAVARSSMNSNMLQQSCEPRGNTHVMQIPSSEIGRNSVYMDSERNHYSAFTRDDLSRRSPARPLRAAQSLSPPPYRTEMQRVPLTRPVDPSSIPNVLSNDIIFRSRSSAAVPMMTPGVETVRPAAHLPQANGLAQRNLSMGQAPITVSGLLHSLGLGKYAIYFQAEEVDMTALKQMGEKDLKDLGIPMGPRKKILQALATLTKRRLPRHL